MLLKDFIELQKFPLFAGLSEPVLRRLQQVCTVRDIAAGHVVVSYLDDDTDVYFVLSGAATVRIYSSQGRVVGFRKLGQGEIFGEFAAIDHAPRSASVEADSPMRLAVVSSAAFRQLVEEVPDVSIKLIRHLVGQLRLLTARVVELSTMAVNDRIEAELLRIAEVHGCRDRATANRIRIVSLPTQCELASRIGTHREAVSRHLSYLSRAGIIRREGRSLVIEDMHRLSLMVSNAASD